MKLTLLRRNAPVLIVYGLLVLMFLAGWWQSPRFLTPQNLTNILRQAAFLGTAALGQMLVILTGGIDLSIGSLVKLALLIAAVVMDGKPENILLAVLVTLALGALVGLIHALVVTRLHVSPFIVTLGTYSILRGIAFAVTTKPIGRAAPGFLQLYDLRLGLLPVLVLGFVLLLVLIALVLRATPFGRYIYAVGGNEPAALLSGLPVDRVKVGVYVLCSMLAALTALLNLSRYGIGDPVIGDGLELQTITAAILGGTSLAGGRGTVLGLVGGVLLLGLTSNLLIVFNVNQYLQGLVEGIIIVLAVALYKQKGRR